MKTYFSNVQTLDELRKQYRDLLKKYHPDNSGSEGETKAINVNMYYSIFSIVTAVPLAETPIILEENIK